MHVEIRRPLQALEGIETGRFILPILTMVIMVSYNRKDSDLDVEIIEKQEYQVDDLLDTFDWIGKSINDLCIDEKYIDSVSVAVKGRIYGSFAQGTVFFDPADDNRKIFHEVILYVDLKDLSFDECLTHLEKDYGKPSSSGEEPYVEANGGTVIWYRFNARKGIVHISMGENNTFYTIRYNKTN